MKKLRTLFLITAVISAAVSFPVFAEPFETAKADDIAEEAVFAEAAESIPDKPFEADAFFPSEVTDTNLAGDGEEEIKWFITADPDHAGTNRLTIVSAGSVPETGVLASGIFEAFEIFSAETVPWKNYKETLSSVRIGSADDPVKVRNAAFWFSGCTALTDVSLDHLTVWLWSAGDNNSMEQMFAGCTALTVLNLDKWTAYASCMDGMFEGCSNLKTIYADSQNSGFHPGSQLRASADVFEGCTSLVAEAGEFYEKTAYVDLVDPITGEKDVSEAFAVVNGYYGRRGIFTESNPDVNYDGLHVRFNHKWLEFPAGVRSVTYDMKPFGADSGTIIINKNSDGLINEVIIDSVKLSAYEKDIYEEDPGMLLIDAKVINDYKVILRGESDIMFMEEPDRSPGDDALLVLAPAGSHVDISGENGASVKLSGLNAQEYKNGRMIPSVFRFSDLTVSSHILDSYAMMVYATQIRFDRCRIDTKTMSEPHCFILGSGNYDLNEEDYRVEFYDTSLKAVNLIDNTWQQGYGAPSPSAFNVSHTAVELHNCDVDLHLPHIPIGECRGVFMLHGGLTIDGGNFKAVLGNDPVETPSLEVSCGIQAVYVNILNHAKVDLDVSLDLDKYTNPENTVSSWGIIYARNTIVEDSELTIKAQGSNGQGIYYYGRSSEPDSFSAPGKQLLVSGDFGYVSRKHASLSEDLGSPDPEAYHKYGDVILRNSDVSIKTSGDAKNYVSTGISCRHLYFDYPLGSKKKTDIEVSEVNDRCLTVSVYDFQGNGNLTYQNGAKLLSPENASVINTEYPAFYDSTRFYTYADADSTETDLKKTAVRHVTIGAASLPYVPSGGSSAASALYTGSWEKPVTGGTWTHNADGTWSFATTQRFVSTWGCIANPYAGGKADWFYFDRDGRMVTGWCWLPWKGVTRCYFFNPFSDGRQGACQLGGTTYDGFTVDDSGAWTVNGVVQSK